MGSSTPGGQRHKEIHRVFRERGTKAMRQWGEVGALTFRPRSSGLVWKVMGSYIRSLEAWGKWDLSRGFLSLSQGGCRTDPM